jgi:hypothetical protein
VFQAFWELIAIDKVHDQLGFASHSNAEKL